jgi:hypothetical protein
MTRKKVLSIDSTKGGNGDIWMRLVSLYSVAALYSDLEIRLLIPQFLRPLANHAFSDRLTILEDERKVNLKYSSLGIKDLFRGFLRGETYILPYQRSIIIDKKQRLLKDSINILLFNFAQHFGLVHIPDWKWITVYQGFLDIIGIKNLRKIEYLSFQSQLRSDYEIIFKRLHSNVPTSIELQVPQDLAQNILVFPTGTSRQFIPVWWARKNLPNAYYAFFSKDPEAIEFEKEGLKTVKYYKEPGDMIVLSNHSLWTISTDSFSSHILQSSTKNSTITLTEVLKSRIISPAYTGKVVDSTAPCHPCLHLDRKNHPLCAAGYEECINWKDSNYSRKIIESIPDFM